MHPLFTKQLTDDLINLVICSYNIIIMFVCYWTQIGYNLPHTHKLSFYLYLNGVFCVLLVKLCANVISINFCLFFLHAHTDHPLRTKWHRGCNESSSTYCLKFYASNDRKRTMMKMNSNNSVMLFSPMLTYFKCRPM